MIISSTLRRLRDFVAARRRLAATRYRVAWPVRERLIREAIEIPECPCGAGRPALALHGLEVRTRCGACGRVAPLRGRYREEPRGSLRSGDTVAIFSDNPPDHVDNWLGGLLGFFEQHDIRVLVSHERKRPVIAEQLATGRLAHLFVWNGERSYHWQMRQRCHANQVPVTVLEAGYFPQPDYYVMDPVGINASASVMYDDLQWIAPHHLQQVAARRESCLSQHPRQQGEYVLCPLQLSEDTNVVQNSPYTTMQQLVDELDAEYAGQPVLYKTHPRDPKNHRYRTRNRVVSSGSFLDYAARATAVVGINSTSLLEAALMGTPVATKGVSLLNDRPDVDRLLAALLERQIPVGETNVAYWLQRYARVSLER